LKAYNPFLFALSLLFALYAHAQKPVLTSKDSIVESYWLVGLGTNAVDDAGDEFRRLFDVKDAWNIAPYPSRLSLGHYLKNGVGFELIGAINKYREGKNIDDLVITEDIDFFSLDFRLGYDLNRILGETGFFDPYLGIGMGYTDANHQGRGTYNAVVGFRLWLSERWGMDFSSSGKWTMNVANSTNYLQHAAGAVYRFGMEKEISRQGLEKLALLEALEREMEKERDSLARLERDERLRAERLEKEREARELALEQERIQAEKARRVALQQEVDALGTVYFKFDSSYLTAKDKTVLDQLVALMNREPTIAIMVSSHTDSRGTDNYNQWLSERRAARTVEYMVAQGISATRIGHGGHGEYRLVNECADGVACSEDKHAKNRRSEFLITEF